VLFHFENRQVFLPHPVFIGLTVVMQVEVKVWCYPMGKVQGLLVIKGWACVCAAVD
jgi:hypothetical protein